MTFGTDSLAVMCAVTDFLDHDSGPRDSIKETGITQIDCGVRKVSLRYCQSSIIQKGNDEAVITMVSVAAVHHECATINPRLARISSRSFSNESMMKVSPVSSLYSLSENFA
jgi:hypothetical protein